MGCDNCTCGDPVKHVHFDDFKVSAGPGGAEGVILTDEDGPRADRTCGGCDQPITGRHGFTSVKTGDSYTYLHCACTPDDAA